MLKNVALQSNGGVATASSYDGINVPSNANNGSTAVGNGNNWYSTVTNPKLMITFDNIYSINKVKLFTTDTWGNSFSDFDLYYTTNDSLTVNDPVASFQSIGHFSSTTWRNAMGSVAFSPVSAKKVLLIPNGTSLALSELEVYTSPSIKTLNDELTIGDFIPCKYTATASGVLGNFSEIGTASTTFIPEVSSPTPNGMFYWIYVGKDYLGRKKFIPDRNLQTYISWDTINKAGLCNGNEILFNECINKSVTSSNYYGTGYEPSNLVNGILDTTASGGASFCWNGNQLSSSPWVKVDFGKETKINTVGFNFRPYVSDAYFKNVKLTFSDGTSQIITLSNRNADGVSGINIGSNIENIKINDVNTTFVKIEPIDTYNTSYSYLGIGEFTASYKGQNNYTIRLITGGTSATDTEDEWDKIIVNSNLNSTITAGDNSVWNWSGIYSWTSTTLPSASDNRIIRGSVSCSQFNNNASNAAASSIGFRPVLLIETLRTVKYLLRKDSNYYAIASNYYDTTNHIFTPLTLAGGTTPNESDVDSFGFTDLNLITNNMTAGSDTFRPIDKFTDNFDLELYLS